MGTWTAQQAYGDSALLLGVGFDEIWRVPEEAGHTESFGYLKVRASEAVGQEKIMNLVCKKASIALDFEFSQGKLGFDFQ